MEFQKWIERNIPGLRMLLIATNRKYVPGAVLRWDNSRYKGHLRDIMGGSDEEWAVSWGEASLVYGQITGKLRAGGGLNVLGLFSINASVQDDLYVDYSISDVRACEYDVQSELKLRPTLYALRQTNPVAWDMINDQFLVTEAYCAAEFKATFKRGSQLAVKAEVEPDIKINASVDHEWSTTNELRLTNAASVPFGVRGFFV